MKAYTTLVKAGMKRHRGSLLGIFFLLFLVSLALGTVMTLWINSGNYLAQEMERAGFGSLTAWVSGVPDEELLCRQIAAVPEVERVEAQQIIYTNYTALEQESDSEGQLILYDSRENRYRFFTDDLSGYREETPEILPGEVYVSPSMASMFGLGTGDEIVFPIARGGRNLVLTVKGYYEDPFMGSSMIGMKGFLFCESDYEEALEIIESSGIDALARSGQMLHIFAADGETAETVAELNSKLNAAADLQTYAEFVHSRNAIYGFMLVLQNAFSGLLLAFVLALLIAVVIILAHSLASGIEADYTNMGILKTVGYTGTDLCRVQLMQYLSAVLAGLLAGLCPVVPVSSMVSRITVTTTGILVPADIPILWCGGAYLAVFLLLAAFIALRCGSIRRIAPMKAIRGETLGREKQSGVGVLRCVPIRKNVLSFRLALRQFMTGRRRYLGACIVAALLVFFVSLVGRMDGWLGADGKGMMDAFNPADHDLGVQVFGNLEIEEAEEEIRAYTEITDSYLLAMPGVAVNGVDYTANVIDQPERFHIMSGESCMADNEVVLTEFASLDLGVEIGDTVTVSGDAGSGEYIVSGIYQCANDMGDNIGMSREGYLKIGQDSPQLWCHHYFLADTELKPDIQAALEEAYGGDIHVHENSWPGLYGIIAAMRGLVAFMYFAVAVFTLTVTAMTGSRILSAEQKDMGIYKALGFTTGKLRLTFALRFGMAAVMGGIAGTLLAALTTDALVSFVMRFAGISNFASSPGMAGILYPTVFVAVLYFLFAYLTAGKIKGVDMNVLTAEQ